MSDSIVCTIDGDVLRVTLNEAASGNAMTNEMSARLAEILEGAGDVARLVVLRAAGDDFCIGRSTMGRKRTSLPEALALRRNNDVVFRCYGAFRRSAIPVIAVVQGKALGFGTALAAAADITMATANATFQLPEFGHNIMPTMAMSALLGKVPAKALMYLAYSTRQMGAEEALRLGIVSDVLDVEAMDGAVDALTTAILAAPLPAVLAIKEFVRTAPGMNINDAIEYARALHATVNSSSEMRREVEQEKPR